MSATQIAYLVVLGVCILASGFFSGSETALIGIPRERVPQLEGKRGGRQLASLIAQPDVMLSTLLVGNNFVNILGAAAATVLFVDLLGEDWGPWAATGVVTSIILVVGEITPKSLATRFPVRFALTVSPTVWRLSLVLRPIASFFRAIAGWLIRLLHLDGPGDGEAITEDDIRAMAVLSERAGEIEATEREIIHSLFGLADRQVREVMTPRVDIVSLQWPAGVDRLRRAVAETGHSRFPVVREDLDGLVGVLYAKDVLRLPTDPGADDIAKLVREPHYVPETKTILELLQEMRTRRYAFAIVLDEHGGVEGLVTVKDLVAELVGEMQDEYDPGTPSIVRVGPNQWVADGRLPLEELAETVERELPSGAFTTVGGLYLHLAGKIPSEGETISTNGVSMTVITMDRHRIDRVRIDANA